MPRFSWLQPIQLQRWPVRTVESPELCYRIDIARHWSDKPLVRQGTNDVGHAYCGPFPSDWCVIDYMPAADPAADLRAWQENLLLIYGFPVLILAEPYLYQAHLYEWQYVGTDNDYAQKMAVDELHLYEGLAQSPEHPAELARIYVVLARRATQAWKIALTFSTACMPGTPASAIESNDHRRAAATFGTLTLQNATPHPPQ